MAVVDGRTDGSDMGEKLEEKVRTGQRIVRNQDAARAALRRHPLFGTQPEEEQEKVFLQMMKDPHLYEKIASERVRVTEADVLLRLEEFRSAIEKKHGAYDALLDPEEPTAYLHQEERTLYERKRLIDKYFGWIVGDTHAADYIRSLRGTMKERHTTFILKQAQTMLQTAEEQAASIIALDRESVKKLYSFRRQAKQEGSSIRMARERIADLTADISNLTSRIEGLSEADGSVEELLATRDRLEDQLQLYRGVKDEATANIIRIKRESENEIYWQEHYAGARSDFENLALEARITKDDLDLCLKGGISRINPSQIATVVRVFVDLRRKTSELKNALGALYSGPMFPSPLVPDADDPVTALERKAKTHYRAELQTAREQDALDFVDKIDQYIQPVR